MQTLLTKIGLGSQPYPMFYVERQQVNNQRLHSVQKN